MARANKKEHARPHLRTIPGGQRHEAEKPRSAVESLLSGQVSKPSGKPRRRKRGEVPPQELPANIQPLADVFAAGRTVDKEVSFKLAYAKQQVERYCVRDWIRRFATTSRRPPSLDYAADHARFKFVMTSRTILTSEKAEELRSLGIAVDEHTELRDIAINYDAIREHKLEDKLRKALSDLDVPSDVIEECFAPKIELKETFYDLLVEIVRHSLRKGEELEEKLKQVVEVLNPTNQIRNTEAVGLTIEQCFDLVHQAEIQAEEEVA